MLRLIKYMKPFAILIIAIICLLFAQAQTDLALPSYMANVISVGIQQKGVENSVPEIIRKSAFENLELFMSNDDKTFVSKYYTEVDSSKWDDELTSYPISKDQSKVSKENLYVLDKNISKNNNDKLNKIFSTPMMTATIINKDPVTFKKNLVNEINDANAKHAQAQGIDPSTIPTDNYDQKDSYTIIKELPLVAQEALISPIKDQVKDIPSMITTATGATFVQNEYVSIGIDGEQLQLDYIYKTGGIMLLIAFAGMIAIICVGFLAARISSGLGKNLRKLLFRKVNTFSNLEIDKFSTASLITRTTTDVQQIQDLMVMLLRFLFYAPILGIGGILKVMNTDSSMTWIIAAAVGIILVVIIILFIVAVPKFKLVQKYIDELNLVTREFLNGLPVIRAFNTQKDTESKFDVVNTKIKNNTLFISRLMVIMMPIMMLVMNGVSLLIVWFGSKAVDNGSLMIGDMMSFIQYSMQIIMAFLMISMVAIMLPRASVAASRVCDVLDTDPSIINNTSANPIDSAHVEGVIEFKNVSFKFPGAEENAVENINFIAKPGETTAFIGSTGSGKSTVINLLPRFYDVTDGKILLDGKDIRDLSLHDLRSTLGYVPQKAILFGGTIESNLKLGAVNASQKDLETAVAIAQSTEFINEKPEKYEEPISQGGTNVSGGQRQRLSIARALATKAKVLIFDDSFSALDFKTDASLRHALREKNKTEKSTILLVAQRISSIIDAEQIIVLDEGKIVGIGTHNELLKSCEVYKEIAYSQLSKEELGYE